MVDAMRLGFLLAALALVGVACSDDSTSPSVSHSPAPPSALVFDQVKHVVLEPVRTDVHETISVLAHVCPATASGCPDGTEEILPMASHHLIPQQLYMSHPEVYLEPPDACRAADTVCYLSVAHCEFASRDDQAAGGACLPDVDAVGAAASDWRAGATATCVRREATHSHHIDHGCLREGAS